MLRGEGNDGERWKTTKVKLAKKSNFARAAHFLYISLPFICTNTTWNFQKLPSYRFYGGNVVRVLVHFFSLTLISTLHWRPLAFLVLPPPLQNFHVVLPTKKCLLCFPSFALDLCRRFQSCWASLACHLLSSFSLSFSCSIFQICGHDK